MGAIKSARISLSINGNPQYTAALSGAGYLSAHLNVRNRPREDHLSAVVELDATDTSQQTETSPCIGLRCRSMPAMSWN